MMNAKESKEFNFDEIGDDGYPDSLYHEETKDLRLEKINQRVTIITILLPCLIGVILFIAYRDLTGRVSQSEFSGSKEVQALSEELEEKFKNIANQFSAVQTSLDEKITPIEKTITGLNENFKKLNNIDESLKQNLDKSGTTLKTISASKVDKKEHTAAIEKINNSMSLIREDLEALAPISKEIKSLSSEMQAIDKRLKKDLTSFSETMIRSDNDLTQIHNDLEKLADRKLDKASLELEILKARKNYERTLDETVIKLERRMDALLKRIKQLERNLRQLEAAATQTTTTKTPKTGEIIEQEIKE
jgi:DNA repair exonuclease SbcCD ATPase subunit